MNQTTSNTVTYNQPSTINTTTQYPFFSSSLTYGILGGGLTALAFFILQSLGMEDAIGWKYAPYGLLGIIIAIALGDYDRFLKTGTTFRKGMVFAAQISLITGVTLIVINTITFFINSNLVFSKYGKEAIDFPSLLTINGAVFLEIMVVGLIFTLISLQFYKSRRDYKG